MLRYTLVALMLTGWLAACMPNNAPLGPNSSDSPQPAGAPVIEVEVARERVFTLRDGAQESIPASSQVAQINPQMQGVGVDKDGRVLLRLPGRITLELLRGAELPQIQQSDTDVKIAQNGGTLIADLTTAANPQFSLTVQTAFGTIVAANARFAVVREENSPLEWVLALETGANSQLNVIAGGVSVPLAGGQARWLTTTGQPGPAIVLSPDTQNWLEGARNNAVQPEIGAVLLSPANILAEPTLLKSPLRTDHPVEFGRDVHGAVQLWLNPVGIFGSPAYTLEDCNADGQADLAVKNGILRFDFEELLARVQAIDVTVLNRDQPGRGLLQAFDPAGAPTGQQPLQVEPGQTQTLSLRGDSPYHAAELRLSDACFLGLSLTPPGEDSRQPAPAREIAPQVQRDDVVNVLAAAGERRPENGQFQAPRVTPGQLQIDGQLADWAQLTQKSGVDWSPVSAAVYDNGCANRFPQAAAAVDLAGQVLFAYDDQNFYVAFRVDDDGLATYSGGDNRIFLGDSAQLLLDLDLNGDFDSASLTGDDVQVDMLASADVPRVVLWQLGSLTSSQITAATITVTPSASGYVLEAALPWAALATSPRPGDRLGIVAAVNDNDTPGSNTQECIIATAPQRDWRNPTTWGTVLLQPTPVE